MALRQPCPRMPWIGLQVMDATVAGARPSQKSQTPGKDDSLIAAALKASCHLNDKLIRVANMSTEKPDFRDMQVLNVGDPWRKAAFTRAAVELWQTRQISVVRSVIRIGQSCLILHASRATERREQRDFFLSECVTGVPR